MYKTARIVLKESDPLKQVFDKQSNEAKLFKNAVIFRLRQLIFAWRKDYKDLSEHEMQVLAEFKLTEPKYKAISKKHSLPNYEQLDNVFKVTKNPDYYNNLPMQCTQQIIKECLSDFKSYLKSAKDYNKNPSKYTGRPNLPKYSRVDHISYDITNQDAVVYEHKEIIDNKEIITYELKLPKTTHRLNLGTLKIDTLKEVTIKPYYNTYEIFLVYEEEVQPLYLDENRILAIDLGIDNFLTTSNNVGLTPFIINGKVMKSKNQYYNKKSSKLKSLLEKGQYTSKRLQRLHKYRNDYFTNSMHQISAYIIKYCIDNNIGVIVVGKNDFWKQEVNIGKVNNQKFGNIPHSLFISKLKYKAEAVGIKVIVREESYTSKASFLDMDNIPTYSKDDENTYIFSGKRITRGMYKSKEGILINADINGASNILRKEFPDAFNKITDFSYLYKTVEKITIEKLCIN